MTNPTPVAIIGGGPGGLMLARLLHLHGREAVVFERDTHPDERPQGGSLDLHADTGQRAMRLAGLEEAFAAEARPEDQGDRLYDPAGTLLFDRNEPGDGRPEIDRTALRRILLRSLRPGAVRWGSRVEAVEIGRDGPVVVADGRREPFATVVGADGAWSRVRAALTPTGPVYEGVTFVELGFDAARHPGIDALVGRGKMFAVGDNRLLIAQRNGHGHIRGYAALRLDEGVARELAAAAPAELRRRLRAAFAGWAESLTDLVGSGDLLGVRPLYALPPGARWTSRPGVTLLGDAAHLMSPFGGEGVNLALADAADLAAALVAGSGWGAVEVYEAAMIARAEPAGQDAAAGLAGAVSPAGVEAVLAHYRERVAA